MIARGLAIAAQQRGITFVAVPAPIATAAAIVAAFEAAREPLVAWAGDRLAVVGVGVARELRGRGATRWTDVACGAADVIAAGAVIDGALVPCDALGFARPRFVGGGAFTPGAADRAPWRGFGDAWFALPRWTYTSDGTRALLVLAIDADDARDPARWHADLAILQRALVSPFVHRPQPPLAWLRAADPSQWRDQVTAITAAIARGACSKIVAARSCRLALDGDIHVADLLAALDARHAECVRVLVRPPHGASLVAATPERLVRRCGHDVWCDALAGTIAHGDLATAAAALLASPKDRAEHELVVRAIRGVLDEVGDVSAPAAPVVRALRHVLHLHTPLRATLRRPRHILELAARLQPTPAVGGTPTPLACEWIAQHEPEPRGWYGAPVGWFDLDGDGELAVAIRSGVIAGDRAQLWAGAGIVAGSDPDRELAETEIKLRAMLDALGVARRPVPRIPAPAQIGEVR